MSYLLNADPCKSLSTPNTSEDFLEIPIFCEFMSTGLHSELGRRTFGDIILTPCDLFILSGVEVRIFLSEDERLRGLPAS